MVRLLSTLIKKKIKFSSYIGKFRVEQLQSHIMRKGFLKCEEMGKYFPIYEEASSLGRYVFGSEISYNKAPPRLPGLGC